MQIPWKIKFLWILNEWMGNITPDKLKMGIFKRH